MERHEMSRYIDSTMLRPDATARDIVKLCEEAVRYRFYAVCVNPSRVELAARCLRGETVRLCTVVGFPLGADVVPVKLKQVDAAMKAGACEVDAVMNIGLFKDKEYRAVEEEVQSLSQAVHEAGGVVKIIVETGCLEREEIEIATSLVAAGGADFIKTCTGFGPRGVTLEDISIIRSVAPESLKIKASGGIKTYRQALELIKLGVNRIGTSQAAALVSAG